MKNEEGHYVAESTADILAHEPKMVYPERFKPGVIRARMVTKFLGMDRLITVYCPDEFWPEHFAKPEEIVSRETD